MLRARDIIDQARDYHPDFNDHVVTGPVLLRQLSRLQRTLAEKIFATSETAMAATEEFTPTDITYGFTTGDGLELPEHLLLLQAQVTTDDGTTRDLAVIPHAQRLDRGAIWPAAYLLGGTLYLVDRRAFGEGGSGWERVTGISVTYVPAPRQLTSPDSRLTVPDRAEPVLVAQLAHHMASRLGITSELPGLAEEATAAEEAMLHGIAQHDTTTTWMVRRV
jgi:hypothetical protein